jgi:hypothetical protein
MLDVGFWMLVKKTGAKRLFSSNIHFSKVRFLHCSRILPVRNRPDDQSISIRRRFKEKPARSAFLQPTSKIQHPFLGYFFATDLTISVSRSTDPVTTTRISFFTNRTLAPSGAVCDMTLRFPSSLSFKKFPSSLRSANSVVPGFTAQCLRIVFRCRPEAFGIASWLPRVKALAPFTGA